MSKTTSLALVCGLVALAVSACASQPRAITVSAAADLEPAFMELGATFERETNVHVTFNFGSSGMLSQQIEQGAPADVFAAANRAYVDDLAKRAFVLPASVKLYARGQIILWTRADSPLHLQSLADLASPQVIRVAIANPEHAPYGVAAREALQNAGVWAAVQPKLVFAENVQQTLQYAATGNVDAAIIALSLSVGSGGRWVVIPQNLYTPLDQAIGVVKGTRDERDAEAFEALVTGPTGQAVLGRYGFAAP